MEYVKNQNFKFEVSLSNIGYNIKPDGKAIASMDFHRVYANIEQLADALEQGHAIHSVYNDETFGAKYSRAKNFKYTSIIPIDIDSSNISMAEYVNQLLFKPSISYPSYSDSEDNHRFHLLYVFDTKIDKKLYPIYYRTLLNGLEKTDDSVDKCMRSPYQMVYGTKRNTPFIVNNNVYHFNDTELLYEGYKQDPATLLSDLKMEDFDTEVLSDAKILPRQDFIFKYNDNISHLKEINYINVENENRYWLVGDNSIMHRYDYKRYSVDGESHIERVPFKWKDGHNRHGKLFGSAMRLRNLNPTITPTEMFIWLMKEVYTYFDNHDNKFDVCSLLRTTNRLCTSCSNINDRNHPEFKINRLEAIRRNISSQKLAAEVRYDRHPPKSEQIGEYYDASLTDKENIRVMKECGLSISIRTLKNWRKRHNIAIYKKQHKNGNDNMK